MKMIKAIWDTETLGVDTYEVTIESGDTKEDILSIINEFTSLDRVYCVLKIPAESYRVCVEPANQGFVFFESQLSLKTTKKVFERVKESIGKFCTPREYVKLDKDNIGNLLDELDKGLFTTDRISLNPAFGVKTANMRYKKWILSSLEDPFYRITQSYIDDQPAGFGMDKVSFPEAIGLLGATYKSFKKEGIFLNGLYDSLDYYFSEGCTTFKTSISSNNFQMLKIYQALSVYIANIYYVFTLTKI